MRKRLKGRRKNRPLRIIVSVLLFAAFLFLFLKMYSIVRYTVRSYAQSAVEELANEAMHNAIRDACAEGAEYSDLVNVYRNEDGKIESLTLNYANVNILKSDIALKTLEYLDDNERLRVSIPLGNLTGSDLLSGLGPGIKVKIIPNSIAYIDFESSFTQAGINQVRHSISVNVSVNITALLPNYTELSKLTTRAVVTEAVIIGDVPDTYLNIGGKNK